MKVWVLNYNHRFGTDTNVYATEAAAIKGRADLIMSNLCDIDEDEDADIIPSLRSCYAAEQYMEVYEKWSDYQCDNANDPETFELAEQKVIG